MPITTLVWFRRDLRLADNPATQATRFDPQGTYVREWVPELARIPNEYPSTMGGKAIMHAQVRSLSEAMTGGAKPNSYNPTSAAPCPPRRRSAQSRPAMRRPWPDRRAPRD